MKELIAYAFDEFGYDEPFGMNIVTIFQPMNSNTSTGWFTTEVSRKCVDEIEKNHGEMCFAYYLPDVFYFAEGGWGHHMEELGNHPIIPNAVTINLRVDDVENTVVINGTYSLNDVINALKRTGYVNIDYKHVMVSIREGYFRGKYIIPITDRIVDAPLSGFAENIKQYIAKHVKSEAPDIINCELEIVP